MSRFIAIAADVCSFRFFAGTNGRTERSDCIYAVTAGRPMLALTDDCRDASTAPVPVVYPAPGGPSVGGVLVCAPFTCWMPFGLRACVSVFLCLFLSVFVCVCMQYGTVDRKSKQ